MRETIKYLWKKINWDIVQVIFIIGLIPSWLIIGAIFFPMLTSYYGR